MRIRRHRKRCANFGIDGSTNSIRGVRVPIGRLVLNHWVDPSIGSSSSGIRSIPSGGRSLSRCQCLSRVLPVAGRLGRRCVGFSGPIWNDPNFCKCCAHQVSLLFLNGRSTTGLAINDEVGQPGSARFRYVFAARSTRSSGSRLGSSRPVRFRSAYASRILACVRYLATFADSRIGGAHADIPFGGSYSWSPIWQTASRN